MIRVGMPENVNPQCCLSFPNHKFKTIKNKQPYGMCLILYLIIRIVLSILLLLCMYTSWHE